MKALVLIGVKEFEIRDLDTLEILSNEVLINTAYAGVCGTNHDLYAGHPGSASAVPPIVLGHENSGVVAAVGSAVTNVKVGDRVAVDPNIYCGQCEFCLTQRPELCDHLSAVGVTRNGGLAELHCTCIRGLQAARQCLPTRCCGKGAAASPARYNVCIMKRLPRC